MYNYTGLRDFSGLPSQPVDNMSINGVYIDELIDGYRQLQVSGRSLVSRTVNVTDIPMRPGTWLNYTQDEPRVLSIKFLLEAQTSDILRDKYTQLNKLLRGNVNELAEIRFDDEPKYSYYGVFSEAGNEYETALKIIDEFSIYCPDPYKYRDTNTSNDGVIELEDATEVQPIRIEAEVISNGNELAINTSEQSIKLKGYYEANDKLVITWGDEIGITINGRNALFELQQFSNPEFFVLKDGQRVTGTNLRVTLVEWRDQRL